jgi:hypothetical protein
VKKLNVWKKNWQKYLIDKIAKAFELIVKILKYPVIEPDWIKFRNNIRNHCKNSDDFPILNFSKRGFDYIFEAIIESTQVELIIFVKNKDSIFDRYNMLIFKKLIHILERQCGNVKVFTFDGNDDSEFIELDKRFKCFKYISLKPDEQYHNNFIVSDCKRYWYEEEYTAMKRMTIDDDTFIKAHANFANYKNVNKLMYMIRNID